jgi:hypothetical protein
LSYLSNKKIRRNAELFSVPYKTVEVHWSWISLCLQQSLCTFVKKVLVIKLQNVYTIYIYLGCFCSIILEYLKSSCLSSKQVYQHYSQSLFLLLYRRNLNSDYETFCCAFYVKYLLTNFSRNVIFVKLKQPTPVPCLF